MICLCVENECVVLCISSVSFRATRILINRITNKRLKSCEKSKKNLRLGSGRANRNDEMPICLLAVIL